MFSLRTDIQNNKLVASFSGHVDLKQAEELYAQFQKAVSRLKKGFVLVMDLSSLERMDLDARVSIEKIMDLMNKSGISRVIRIIPDEEKDIGFNIMSLFHYSKGVAVHTYKSYQEAEEILGVDTREER